MKKIYLTALMAVFLCPAAFAQGLHDIVTKGSTDRSVTIKIIDSSDGTPETGVEHNTSGIDLWYRREGAAATSITEAALAALTTAHTDGGIEHVGNGVYRLDLPDAAFATSANYVDFGGTVTGMIVIGGRVRLVDTDFEDPITCDDLGIVLGCESAVTIDAVTSQTQLSLSSGPTNDDAYTDGFQLCVWGGTEFDCVDITDYTASGNNVVISEVMNFTVQTSDTARVFKNGFATVSGVVDANLKQIDDDATAAQNAEAFFDNTGFNASASSIGDLNLLYGTFLNCEVNTANFAGDSDEFACILTDLDGSPVTQASGDLEGLQIVVTSGAQIREIRYINDSTWDGANSELQLQLSRALPGTLADAVTVVIR